MKKNIAVDFSGEIPRIITGHSGEPEEGLVINPNLSAVKGIPPHCWHLKDGEIVRGEPREIKPTTKAFLKKEEPQVITKEIIRVIKPQYIDRTKTEYLDKKWHSCAIIVTLFLSIISLILTITKG